MVANKVDPQVDQCTESEKGYHFMRKADEYSMSDPDSQSRKQMVRFITASPHTSFW